MKQNLVNITKINLSNKIFLLILFCFPIIVILRSAAINTATLITSAIFLFFLIKKVQTNFFKDRILVYLIAFFFLFLLIHYFTINILL